jgi:hypothetical protein
MINSKHEIPACGRQAKLEIKILNPKLETLNFYPVKYGMSYFWFDSRDSAGRAGSSISCRIT